MGDVREAFDASIAAASHLTDMDLGAVEAARALADKIDAWDVIVEWALDDAAQLERRPAVPANDNVSLASFLKYCESLGLTPTARKNLEAKGGAGGKLAQLRAIEGGRKSG